LWALAWQYVAVIFGIGLAVSSYFLVIQQRPPSSNQRANGSGIILLAPGTGQTIRGPLLFRWERNPQADSYILEIFDAQMRPVWTSSRIHDSRLAPPQEAASLLIRGETYYWMVTGFALDSTRLESGLSSFRFRR
jgi:hypothetical protein